MDVTLFRWALGVVSTVILGLLGLLWTMRKSELNRIESSILREVDRLDSEVKKLREGKHDMQDELAAAIGRCSLLQDDIDKLKSQRFIAEQLRDEIRRMKSDD